MHYLCHVKFPNGWQGHLQCNTLLCIWHCCLCDTHSHMHNTNPPSHHILQYGVWASEEKWEVAAALASTEGVAQLTLSRNRYFYYKRNSSQPVVLQNEVLGVYSVSREKHFSVRNIWMHVRCMQTYEIFLVLWHFWNCLNLQIIYLKLARTGKLSG